MNTTRSPETRVGPLIKAEEFERLLTSAELMNERKSNLKLRDKCLYTGNYPLYKVDHRTVVLYFGGNENNPLFENIEEASRQLLIDGNYRPSKRSIDLVVNNSLEIRHSDLKTTKHKEECCYFVIDTKLYDFTLNEAQRKLAEAVYGKGADFDTSMKMLRDAEIFTTRVNLLNAEYVKKNTPNGSAIVRACWLDFFDYNSNFNAFGRKVNYHNAMCGRPLSVESNAIK